MWLDDFAHIYILAGTPELLELDPLSPYYLANAYPYKTYSIVGQALLETCSPEEFAAIPKTFKVAYPEGYGKAVLNYIEYNEKYPIKPRAFHFTINKP